MKIDGWSAVTVSRSAATEVGVDRFVIGGDNKSLSDPDLAYKVCPNL